MSDIEDTPPDAPSLVKAAVSVLREMLQDGCPFETMLFSPIIDHSRATIEPARATLERGEAGSRASNDGFKMLASDVCSVREDDMHAIVSEIGKLCGFPDEMVISKRTDCGILLQWRNWKTKLERSWRSECEQTPDGNLTGPFLEVRL